MNVNDKAKEWVKFIDFEVNVSVNGLKYKNEALSK